ncbi:hypothetical protein E4U32_004835 [Claviceps aff. humidiphila group G2b]|nr:hypothetical protein E4U32_004835 [Claviceps aff. humidiphila group G2b]
MRAPVTHPQDIKPFRGVPCVEKHLNSWTKNPLLDQIVDQADDYTATQDDLVLFENALRASGIVSTSMQRWESGTGDGESLDAYHGRVLSIYRARGGRDKPVSADQPPLTALEVSSISEWVYLFVLGLQDKSLAHEVITHSVLMSDSFRSALQIVKESD